jgi:hypothetical protein
VGSGRRDLRAAEHREPALQFGSGAARAPHLRREPDLQGCGLNDLEQLEDAPEFRPGVKVTPELVEDFLKGRVKIEV